MSSPAVAIPRCPHCGCELPSLGIFQWQVGPIMILAVHCPDCKKVLNMQVLPMVGQEPSRVQIPS
jgi:hypothetical protein